MDARMRMERRLCSARALPVAEMMHQLLVSRGLHPRPIDASAHVSVAGAEQWHDLWIPVEEEEDARQILTDGGYGDALTRK
jgi:hypothetical protein